MEQREQSVEDHTFEEVVESKGAGGGLTIADLKAVRLQLTAELGHTTLTVREVLDLHEGSVVPLSTLAGEMAEILMNGKLLARGEVVVIGDALHVRIAEIEGVHESPANLGVS